MSAPDPTASRPKAGFLRGQGGVGAVLKSTALAAIKVAVGQRSRALDAPDKKPRAPDRGKGLIEKIAPYPMDD
jgi:hypothetical protein